MCSNQAAPLLAKTPDYAPSPRALMKLIRRLEFLFTVESVKDYVIYSLSWIGKHFQKKTDINVHDGVKHFLSGSCK